MLETFEEFAGRHIDGLYHGALFLHAGDEPLAEDLVLWTLTGAFQAFRHFEEGSPPEHWLEGRLIGVFLGVCAAEAQAAGQDGSGVCGDVADWGHDGLGRGVADESGWLGGLREGRAGVPRSFHRRDGVGHGALRRPGGCAAA